MCTLHWRGIYCYRLSNFRVIMPLAIPSACELPFDELVKNFPHCNWMGIVLCRRGFKDAQTHLSAEEAAPQAHAWFLSTYEHAGRQKCDKAPSSERAQTFNSVRSDGRTQMSKCLQRNRESMAIDASQRRIPPSPRHGENRFPRCERLHYQRDFERCVKQGRRYRNQLLTLYAYWHDEPMRRVAFSVSKRLGKPVIRNRIKRWLREAYRTRRWALRFGVDLLFIVHQTCAMATHEAIDVAVEQLLWRAGVVDEGRLHSMGGASRCYADC